MQKSGADNMYNFLEAILAHDEEFEANLDPMEIAKARIDQANLYKFLTEHNIFEGLDVDPVIVEKVRAELIMFATFRLEALLGIRKVDRPKKEVESKQSGLTPEELVILKKLLQKAGAQPSDVPERKTVHSYDVGYKKAGTSSLYSKYVKASAETAKEPARLESKKMPNHSVVHSNTPSTSQEKKESVEELAAQREQLFNSVVNKGQEWTEEDRKKFNELSAKIAKLTTQKAYMKFYTPKPGIDEENSLSVYRAGLLEQQFHNSLIGRNYTADVGNIDDNSGEKT